MSGVLFYNGCRIKTGVLTEISVTEAEEKDVNFYDYDGFRLLSYTNAEALALTELPSNPIVNENLTFDGWNWTLVQIKNHINNVGSPISVGAMYHTTDDKTHITCKPTETYPTAKLCLTPTNANAVSVDWGDGSPVETWTSSSQETKTHTYSNVTDASVYDIAISCSSGTYSFNTYIAGSANANTLSTYTSVKIAGDVVSAIGNNCFRNCFLIRQISIPVNVTIGDYAFYYCYSLKHITVPSNSSVPSMSIGTYCFCNCYSMKSVSIPANVGGFNGACFSNCVSLRSITLSLTSQMLANCFGNCMSLTSVVIPSGVGTIGNSCFSGCGSLRSVTMLGNVTSIGSNCFYGCNSLTTVTIPSSVTSIASTCFDLCAGICKIYCKPTTPPTLASVDAIPNNRNIVIYVPAASLSTYQSAEKWSTHSSKIKAYNF